MADYYELFQKRLKTVDYINQNKLIEDKIKTFEIALKRAYNRQKVDDITLNSSFMCLINEINTQPQIEKKSFSTLQRNHCKVGDVLYWDKIGTHWIITDENESEGVIFDDDHNIIDGIFQGYISEALWNIRWRDEKTGVEYSQWACTKGPEETSLVRGVKDTIVRDTGNLSLYYYIPKNTPGIELLTRYITIVMNGKKWEIQAWDDISYRYMIELQLVEVPFNKDLDSDNLANGKKELVFTIQSALDTIEKIQLNEMADLTSIKVYNNGEEVKIPIDIEVNNCLLEDNILTFNELGEATIIIKYQDKIYKQYIVQVEETAEDTTYYDIIGEDKVRACTTVSYSLNKYINGDVFNNDLNVKWYISEGSRLATISKIENNTISIKIGSSVGSFTLKAEVDNQIIEKQIKIKTLFGG